MAKRKVAARRRRSAAQALTASAKRSGIEKNTAKQTSKKIMACAK